MNAVAQPTKTLRQKQAGYAQLLPRERVQALSRVTIARPIFDTARCWAMMVGAWVWAAHQPVWWVVAIAAVVVGNRYYALFILGHDALHRRLLPDRVWNDRFADALIFAPIGAITRLNNRNHLLHHAHLATEQDPDRHKYVCFNKAAWMPMIGFLVGLTSVTRNAVHVFFGRKDADAAPVTSTKPASDAGYTLRDVVLLAGWQLGLMIGLTWAIGWWAYPVLWLGPVYGFAILADNVRSFCEHAHAEPDHEADEHRLITYRSFPPEQWFFAPMAMNYHAAHHLWTTIPYHQLKEADRELQAVADGTDLIWRRSYVAYLISYLRGLPHNQCALSTDDQTRDSIALPRTATPSRRAAA